MRIFFLMRHTGYLKHYIDAMKVLAKRGAQVHLAFLSVNKMLPEETLSELIGVEKNISYAILPKVGSSWMFLAKAIRQLQDFLRYLTVDYEKAFKLRARAERRVPDVLVWLCYKIFWLKDERIWNFIYLLRKIERIIPIPTHVKNILSESKAEIFLITPLVDFGASQLDWLKCAQALGMKTALCVASWDNLTNKGLIQIEPDYVFVWNHFQERELYEYHRIKGSEVIVTGAQTFDKWFRKGVSISKDKFCSKIGLKNRDYLLYLCSSPFIAPNEVDFVKRWASAIRNDPDLKQMGILVRPHPQNVDQWRDVTLKMENVVIYPRFSANPIAGSAWEDYFHSLYYCKGVIGINTTAMIEAGILGKPVFTILDKDFEKTQEGTLHFRYLVDVGLLYVSDSLDKHLKQVKSVLKGKNDFSRRVREFTQSFVRPYGLDKEGKTIFADAVSDISKLNPYRYEFKEGIIVTIIRFFIYPFALLFNFVGKLRKFLNKKRKKRKRTPIFRKLSSNLRNMFANIKTVKIKSVKKDVNNWLLSTVLYKANYKKDIDVLKRNFDCICNSDKPIVVGPWCSEIGFELLYWIPFLNYFFRQYKVDRERIIVISRGGAFPWYKHITDNYIDILTYYSPKDFKEKNTKRIAECGGQKHTAFTSFDHELLKMVKSDCNLRDFFWIHPSYMYNLFKHYWRRRVPVSFIERYTDYNYFVDIDSAFPDFPKMNLPENYVAVKFYFSECFPNTKENNKFIFSWIKMLSETVNVVLLNTGLSLDDHEEMELKRIENVFRIDDVLSPEKNIAVQSAIIAKSRFFCGTYGGFSYLPMFYKVSSFAFYSNSEKFLPVHLDIAYRSLRTLEHGFFDKCGKHKKKQTDSRIKKTMFTVMDKDAIGLIDRFITSN